MSHIPFMRNIHRILAAGFVFVAAGSTHAVDYTWDASGGAPADDGSGNWDATGGTNWFDGSTYGAWGNTTSDRAIFGVGSGAAGTITVGTVNANGIIFNAPGSGNYTLSGGTITLGGTPTITANSSATIASTIAGAVTLTKQGVGVLTLSGPNTYSVGTELMAGTISVSDLSGIGSGYLAVKTGAIFQYTGGGSETTSRTLWLDNGASTFDISNASGALTWNGGGTRSQAFTKTGAGTLTMGGRSAAGRR